MLISALRRALRPVRRSIKAFRHGWRWEAVEFAGIIPLTNGQWSRLDGGQIWQRWNGEDYDFRQLAMMP